MVVTLTWRNTSGATTLIKWDGIKQKDDLPYEYVNGATSKFWATAPTTLGDMHYDGCIMMGKDVGRALGVDTVLYVGTVVTKQQYNWITNYLSQAVKRLNDINKQLEEAETITTVL